MSHDHRKAPVSAVFALYPQGKRGICCWCGGGVTERTPGRGWLRYWHDACELEYLIVSQSQIARREVEKRDKGVCSDCAAPPRKETRICIRERGTPWEWQDQIVVELWHVDHGVPLWKVAHLPPLQRLEYFKLPNLVTRCEGCHSRKTKKEAAERAHFRHLASGKKKSKNPMKSRKTAWPKGRKLQGRKFQRRTK